MPVSAGRGASAPCQPCQGFSLLIRGCEEFTSASVHLSVLTELFDEERAAGERLFCLESPSPLSSSCRIL